jgi:hypothetical protein
MALLGWRGVTGLVKILRQAQLRGVVFEGGRWVEEIIAALPIHFWCQDRGVFSTNLRG